MAKRLHQIWKLAGSSRVFARPRPSTFRCSLSTSASSPPRVAYGTVLAATGVLASLLITSQLWSPLSLEAPQAAGTGSTRVIEPAELTQHSTSESVWVCIDGVVWDVTKFVKAHPGGAQVILDNAGKDISAIFRSLHPAGALEKVLSQLIKVGIIPTGSSVLAPKNTDTDIANERRASLFSSDLVVNLSDFEQLAKTVLGELSLGWTYFNSSADDGYTFNANRSSFSFLRFIPRVNIPIGNVDSTTEYFSNGRTVPLPIFMCPTAGSGLAHPEGDLNLTRASAKTQIPQCVSSVATKSILEVLAERDAIVAQGGPRAPIWFQLYINADRSYSEAVLKKVAEKGVDAVLITVDTPVVGNREIHLFEARRMAVEGGTAGKRPGREYDMAPNLGASAHTDANLSWSDVAWVRGLVPNTPILVKGVGAVDDVVLAKKFGADGVVLSNHGGRQLEYAPPPLATLLRLHREEPKLLEDSKFSVYIDGGITRGTDVIKAVALGAKGVGLGRAFVYAEACYGEEGVLRACEILASEVHRGLRLVGAKSLKDLRPEMLEVLPGLVGEQEKSR